MTTAKMRPKMRRRIWCRHHQGSEMRDAVYPLKKKKHTFTLW